MARAAAQALELDDTSTPLPALEGIEPPAPKDDDKEKSEVALKEKPEGEALPKLEGVEEKPAAVKKPKEAKQPVEDDIPYPTTWRGHVKDFWGATSREVREEVARREKEMMDGLGQYKTDADAGRSFNQMLAPYIPALRAAGEEPMQAIQNLLQIKYQMQFDPYGTILGVMQNSGLDFNQLAQRAGVQMGQNGQLAQMDPALRQVLMNQQQMQAHWQMERQQRQIAEQQQADNQIAAFTADPKNEFMQDPQVKQKMAGLLQARLASGLQDAYDQALAMVPHVKAELEKRRTAQSDAERQKQTRRKAADAERASVDVVKGGSPFVESTKESIAEEIGRKLREARAST